MLSAQLLKVEDLAFVVPDPARRLNRGQWAWLEMAMVAANDGDLQGAQVIVWRLEDDLGVTVHDRLVVDLAAAGEFCALDDETRSRQRERRRREKLDRNHAMSLIPRDDAPFTPNNLKAMREADRRIAPSIILKLRRAAQNVGHVGSPHPITRAERQEALAGEHAAKELLNAVEGDLRYRTDERYVARVNIETRSLEEGRGETVVWEKAETANWRGEGKRKALEVDRVRRLRITSRDGLEVVAFKSPAQIKTGDLPISAIQYTAGLRYRELYEKADPERALRPAPIDPDMRGGYSHGGAGWEEKKREITDQLARLDRFVSASAGGGSRGADAVKALQEVAGKANPISKVVSGSRARARMRRALEVALDAVADALGLH